jgi:hypothetical protein
MPRIEQLRDRVGEGGESRFRQQSRPGIARHVPGDGAMGAAEMIELRAEAFGIAADAMQEKQRRPLVAGGDAARRRRHRRAAMSFDSRLLARLRTR